MKFKLILSLCAAILVASCSWGPSDLDETQEQILTVAYKSDTTNFSRFKTYAIVDSLSVVDNGKKYRVKSDTTDMIIAQVVENMNKNGYSWISTDEAADLIVDVSYIENTSTSLYPGFWNDWDAWWYYYDYPWSGWYPYYPFYMPTVVSSYTTGSIIVEIVDMVNVQRESSVPIVWHGLIRSILNYNPAEEEILLSINEVFTILPPK